MLRMTLRADIPEIREHLGTMDPWYRGDRPWQRGFITTGAWREDEENVVNPYSIWLPTGAIPLPTVDHFWDADRGDASENWLRVLIQNQHRKTIGPYMNAYKKIIAYAYPNRSWILKYAPGTSNIYQYDFRRPDGSIVTFTFSIAIGFEYNSLVELYKTGRAWVVGYYDVTGRWINADIRPDILPCEVILTKAYRDKFVWEILGRMCHLLGDTSVPAYAHVDEHASRKFLVFKLVLDLT